MDDSYKVKVKKNFHSICILYLTFNICGNLYGVNIKNFLLDLSGATPFRLGLAVAISLIVSMISILTFGYYTDKIAERFSRKKIFFFTNLSWIMGFGLRPFAPNYYFFLIGVVFAAFGGGAFLPIGYSIIGDSYPPEERGKSFGGMYVALLIGAAVGNIIGGSIGYVLGVSGWRISYGMAGFLGLMALLNYINSGIDLEPGRSDPEFEDFEGEIHHDYKITVDSLFQIFKKKSILGILIYQLFMGVTFAVSTWTIFYLSNKINDKNSILITLTIVLLGGTGAIFGTLVGGRLGDFFYRSEKIRGRVVISVGGLIIGGIIFLIFYLIPFNTTTPSQYFFSFIIFVILYWVGSFLTSLCVGNIYAIYSEVSVPELRGTANAFTGVMASIGGIFGHLIFSFIIERDMNLFPFAISLFISIFLFGTLFWIITYIYYPQESKELRNIMVERRKKLDEKRRLNPT
ncbi:MAG: MFS transporter [Promethearchaeota archaeon]